MIRFEVRPCTAKYGPGSKVRPCDFGVASERTQKARTFREVRPSTQKDIFIEERLPFPKGLHIRSPFRV